MPADHPAARHPPAWSMRRCADEPHAGGALRRARPALDRPRGAAARPARPDPLRHPLRAPPLSSSCATTCCCAGSSACRSISRSFIDSFTKNRERLLTERGGGGLLRGHPRPGRGAQAALPRALLASMAACSRQPPRSRACDRSRRTRATSRRQPAAATEASTSTASGEATQRIVRPPTPTPAWRARARQGSQALLRRPPALREPQRPDRRRASSRRQAARRNARPACGCWPRNVAAGVADA